MYLKVSRRKGRAYLSIVQSYRDRGKVRTKTVQTIGYADAYTDEFEDPIAYFKDYVRQLNEKQQEEDAAITFSLAHNAIIDENQTATARWGAALALAHLDILGVKAFFESNPGRPALSYTGRVFEMLATERMMHVSSKRETWQNRKSFPRPCAFSLEEAYAALESIAQAESSLVKAMGTAYQKHCQPYKTNCIYVVFNAFKFPRTGEADAPKSLTAGIAVVLDRDGMPITYRLIESKLEPHEVPQLVTSIKEEVGAKRAVAITEALAQPRHVARLLAKQGDGLVFHQPLLHQNESLRSWAEDPRGYIASASGTYKAKSRITSWHENNNPSASSVRMKELVLWSRNFAVSEEHPRLHVERPGSCNRQAASEANPTGGYLCVATTETNLPAASVFHLYREVWRLTEPFQVMESDFSPLPYPIARKDHVRAHFLICFAAFFAMRVLRSNMGWTHNAAQVAEALLRMEGTHLQENWFLFNYRSPVTDAVEKASGMNVGRRLRTRKDLHNAAAHAYRHIAKP